jgi:hypothetical protein
VTVDPSELSSEHGRLAVHYDIGKWMSCPPVFPQGYDRKTWARTFAEGFSRRPGLNPSERDIKRLAASLEQIHEYTYSHVACHMCFIHQPHPALTPLPVYMATWRAMGGREEALRRLTNADDPDAAQPPQVEEITTPELGQGLKVFRYGRQPGKRGDAGKIFAALNYAWRNEKLETDLRVFTSTGDVGRLQQAVPDIDELVTVTKIVPVPA